MNAITEIIPEVKKGIRSKQRVKDLAEVFTQPREVNAMLDLVGDITHLPETTFLEPSCGNGAFLTAIVGRKAATVFARHKRQDDIERGLLRSLMSIYAVDISPGNVAESRANMWARVEAAWSEYRTAGMTEAFVNAAQAVLRRNIRVCDFLKGRDDCIMTQYVGPVSGRYVLRDFRLGNPSKILGTRGPAAMAGLPALLDDDFRLQS